jgi:hypothetical protein
MVSIVKQRDVVVGSEAFQKFQQRPRPLREFHSIELLLFDRGTSPAHHMPDMQDGELVIAQPGHGVAMSQALDQSIFRFGQAISFDPKQHMRLAWVSVSVIKLCDAQSTQGSAERQKAAWALGNRDTQEQLLFFPQRGSLGDVPQSIKIDIGTTDQRDVIAPRLLGLSRKPFF